MAYCQRLTDERTKSGDGCIGQEDERQDNRTVLVGNQFTNRDIEAQLNRLAQTVDGGTDDECLDIMRHSTHDDSDDGDDVAADEEPSSSEKV